jgi:hypothetical protein
MKNFFGDVKPFHRVTYGKATIDLPVLYHRDDAFGLYFAADCQRVKAAMPSDKLQPVVLPNKKAIVAVMAFNYIDTSIGPYGELAVAVPAVFGEGLSPFGSLRAALMESAYPGFGLVVMHLPVTCVEARDPGRGEWGYTKFVVDMDFFISPEYQECRLSEGNRHILDIRVQRRGFYLRDNKPLTTFTVKDGDLIKTVIPQTAAKRVSLLTGGSHLKLGDHPMAESIRNLGISSRPFMSIYYPERSAILPSGTVIEKEVSPLDGYFGEDREAFHRVEYP